MAVLSLGSSLEPESASLEHFAIRQQNPYVEGVVGSIRGERLDPRIVFNGNHLRRVLRGDLHDYHGFRTHLTLDKDAPQRRPVEPPTMGRIVEFRKSVGSTT